MTEKEYKAWLNEHINNDTHELIANTEPCGTYGKYNLTYTEYRFNHSNDRYVLIECWNIVYVGSATYINGKLVHEYGYSEPCKTVKVSY